MDDIGPAEHPRLTIGFALLPKKVSRYLTKGMVDAAAARGLLLQKVAPEVPLSQQGHFDAIVHKLRPNAVWEQNLATYVALNPRCVVVDRLDAIRTLHNRATMLSSLSGGGIVMEGPLYPPSPKHILEFEGGQLSESPSAAGGQRPVDGAGRICVRVSTPDQVEIPEGTSTAEAEALLATVGLVPPLLVKPVWTDGREGSHGLAVLHRMSRLADLMTGAISPKLRPPLIVQQFVQHGGAVFKVYVVGSNTIVVRRPSLGELYLGAAAQAQGVVLLPRISCKPSSLAALSPKSSFYNDGATTAAAVAAAQAAQPPAAASAAASPTVGAEPTVSQPVQIPGRSPFGRTSITPPSTPPSGSPPPYFLQAKVSGVHCPSSTATAGVSSTSGGGGPAPSTSPGGRASAFSGCSGSGGGFGPSTSPRSRAASVGGSGGGLSTSPGGSLRGFTLSAGGAGQQQQQQTPLQLPRVSSGGSAGSTARRPEDWVTRALASSLRSRLGMQLFNFDLITPEQQPEGERLYYVIDINYFPGVDKVPNFQHIFLDFLEEMCGRRDLGQAGPPSLPPAASTPPSATSSHMHSLPSSAAPPVSLPDASVSHQPSGSAAPSPAACTACASRHETAACNCQPPLPSVLPLSTLHPQHSEVGGRHADRATTASIMGASAAMAAELHTQQELQQQQQHHPHQVLLGAVSDPGIAPRQHQFGGGGSGGHNSFDDGLLPRASSPTTLTTHPTDVDAAAAAGATPPSPHQSLTSCSVPTLSSQPPPAAAGVSGAGSPPPSLPRTPSEGGSASPSPQPLVATTPSAAGAPSVLPRSPSSGPRSTALGGPSSPVLVAQAALQTANLLQAV